KRIKAAPATICRAAKVTAPLTGEQAGKGPAGTAPSFSALTAIGKATPSPVQRVSQSLLQKSPSASCRLGKGHTRDRSFMLLRQGEGNDHATRAEAAGGERRSVRRGGGTRRDGDILLAVDGVTDRRGADIGARLEGPEKLACGRVEGVEMAVRKLLWTFQT